MGKIIGIDLGTTNSAMAVLEGNEPTIIVNSDGGRTTPSVVAWKDGVRIVGKAALNQAVTNYENTVYSVKRFIGRSYDELTDIDLEGLTYEIDKDEKGRPVVCANNDRMLPEEISAGVLSRLKEDAEKFLGEPVDEAVITVPAYFNDTQRQATKDAGQIAGLKVERIINEPTAAALAYGFGKGGSETKKILVFDLGGGTFDVSILNVSSDFIEVISTAGDNHLGGDIWDSTFCRWLCDRFQQETGIDVSENPMTHSRVLEAARKAKEDLSTSPSVQVNLPFLELLDGVPQHMDYEVTRGDFEKVTEELLVRCKKPIKDALTGSPDNPVNLSMDDIDEIILVGGSTRMPAVKELVRIECGKEPCNTVNPDEVVSMGACVQGGVLAGECQGIILSDVNSMTLGIKTYPNSIANMIPRNTPLPADETKQFTTFEDNQENVEIVLVQGENPLADSPENKILGTTILGGIPPMSAKQPVIEITLKYDVNGIVHVSAVETRSGSKIDVTIEGSTKLTDTEINVLSAAEKSN